MAAADISRALLAEEALASNLDAFVGEWVAVRDHAVVNHAATLRALLDRIDPEGVDRILEVSEESAASCFF